MRHVSNSREGEKEEARSRSQPGLSSNYLFIFFLFGLFCFLASAAFLLIGFSSVAANFWKCAEFVRERVCVKASNEGGYSLVQ